MVGMYLKVSAFSINSACGYSRLRIGAMLGVYVSYHFGLALLGFFNLL